MSYSTRISRYRSKPKVTTPAYDSDLDPFWSPRAPRAAATKSRVLSNAVLEDSDSEVDEGDCYEYNPAAAKEETYESDSDDSVICLGSQPPSPGSGLITPASTPDVASTKPSLVVKLLLRASPPKFFLAAPSDNAGRLFVGLPVEIHQNIAEYLPKDSHIVKFANVCKRLNSSITSSVWRKRFIACFDLPPNTVTAVELGERYQARTRIKRIPINLEFRHETGLSQRGRSTQETIRSACLQVLRELILESNARLEVHAAGNQTVTGLNYEYLRRWVSGNGYDRLDGYQLEIFEVVLNTHSSDFWDPDRVVSAARDDTLILVIQLVLTGLNLRPGVPTTVSNFDGAQIEVYADHQKQPIFVGKWKQDINVRWLLSTAHFFKFHFVQPYGEGLLTELYDDLDTDQKPQFWLGKLEDGTQELGRNWRGSFTYLDEKELSEIRHKNQDHKINPNEPKIWVDRHEDEIQDLSFYFDESEFQSTAWPRRFEHFIHSDPYDDVVDIPRRGTRSSPGVGHQAKKYPFKLFFGSTRDVRPGHFYGRLHGLPPQQSIPGFQRISFIKFCEVDGDPDLEQVWQYEGCVLPGGRIIIGRWRYVSILGGDIQVEPIDENSGPFILWNVDNSTAEPPISSDEAVNFLKVLTDIGMDLSS